MSAPSCRLAGAAQQSTEQAGHRGQQATVIGACCGSTTSAYVARCAHFNRGSNTAQQSTDQAGDRRQQATVSGVTATQAAGQTADQVGNGGQQTAIGAFTAGQTTCQTTEQTCDGGQQATVGSITTAQAAGQTADQIGDRGQQTTVGAFATAQATCQTTEQACNRSQQATVGRITTTQTTRQAAEQAGDWREQATFAITRQPAGQGCDGLGSVIQGVAQRVGIAISLVNQSADRGNCLTQVSHYPAQTQGGSAVQLVTYIAQGTAYPAQQSIDGLANAQSITHLLSDMRDYGTYGSYYGIQGLTYIAQDRVQANRQDVVDCLAYVGQRRFKNGGGIRAVQQTAQPQLASDGVQQTAFTQQGVGQGGDTTSCVTQYRGQWVGVVGIRMQQAACAAYRIAQTIQETTYALTQIQG